MPVRILEVQRGLIAPGPEGQPDQRHRSHLELERCDVLVQPADIQNQPSGVRILFRHLVKSVEENLSSGSLHNPIRQKALYSGQDRGRGGAVGPGEPECRTPPRRIPTPPEAPGHDLPGPTWGPVGPPPQQAVPPEIDSSVYGGKSHYRANEPTGGTGGKNLVGLSCRKDLRYWGLRTDIPCCKKHPVPATI